MPAGPVRLQEITVSEEDVREFMNAFSDALDTVPLELVRNLYLFPKDRHALAISLDGESKPFLGYTAGHNPPSERTYLRGRLRIVHEIAGILTAYDQEIQGGRVFLSEYAASKVIEGSEHTLCTYDWPGPGPYTIGLGMFEARLSQLPDMDG